MERIEPQLKHLCLEMFLSKRLWGGSLSQTGGARVESALQRLPLLFDAWVGMLVKPMPVPALVRFEGEYDTFALRHPSPLTGRCSRLSRLFQSYSRSALMRSRTFETYNPRFWIRGPVTKAIGPVARCRVPRPSRSTPCPRCLLSRRRRSITFGHAPNTHESRRSPPHALPIALAFRRACAFHWSFYHDIKNNCVQLFPSTITNFSRRDMNKSRGDATFEYNSLNVTGGTGSGWTTPNNIAGPDSAYASYNRTAQANPQRLSCPDLRPGSQSNYSRPTAPEIEPMPVNTSEFNQTRPSWCQS